jgi:glycyl-tRNA synthetase alpha chain
VWIDGAEVSQFTFFQQMGGIECNPVCAEITYGPERLCLMRDNQASFWTDLQWNDKLSYKDLDWQLEMQNNVYNFEIADTKMLFELFDMYEQESKRVIETPVFWDSKQGILTSTALEDDSEHFDDVKKSGEEAPPLRETGPMALVYPALDLALRCSHTFNVLDARGAVGVTQRAAYINRIRARVRACCLKYVEQFKTPSAKK